MVTGKSMDYDDNLDALSYPDVAMACPDGPAAVRSPGQDNEFNGVTLSDWKSVAAYLLLSNDHTAGSMDESNFPPNRRRRGPIASRPSYQCNQSCTVHTRGTSACSNRRLQRNAAGDRTTCCSPRELGLVVWASTGPPENKKGMDILTVCSSWIRLCLPASSNHQLLHCSICRLEH